MVRPVAVQSGPGCTEVNKTFHARRSQEPLDARDTETQTVGCRLTNPHACGKNAMPTVCAFARADGMCLSPPASWRKQYVQLVILRDGTK
jgi:hypothetical protein